MWMCWCGECVRCRRRRRIVNAFDCCFGDEFWFVLVGEVAKIWVVYFFVAIFFFRKKHTTAEMWTKQMKREKRFDVCWLVCSQRRRTIVVGEKTKRTLARSWCATTPRRKIYEIVRNKVRKMTWSTRSRKRVNFFLLGNGTTSLEKGKQLAKNHPIVKFSSVSVSKRKWVKNKTVTYFLVEEKENRNTA